MRGSKAEVPLAVDVAGVAIRMTEWGEMTVELATFPAGTDTAPIFANLPGIARRSVPKSAQGLRAAGPDASSLR